jgi:hypothetical protein
LAAIFFDLGAFPFSGIHVIHFLMEKDGVGSARAMSDRYKEGIKTGARRTKFVIVFAVTH